MTADRAPTQKSRGFSRLGLWLFQALMLILTPVFLIIHLRQGAPLRRWGERLGIGIFPTRPMPADKPNIWFHAASLGEVKQIQTLAHTLNDNHETNILVTTFTQAGADWVAANMPFATHKFAPIDIRWCVSRFLRAYAPQTLVIVEGDIWPTLLDTASRAGVPTALINARNSKSRGRFSGFHTKATSYFDLITCPTETIQAELLDVGASKDKIVLIGSLKATKQTPDASLATSIEKLANGRQIITFASTHASDEALLSAVLSQTDMNGFLLVWAPRHDRRVPAVSSILKQAGLSSHMRSDIDTAPPHCSALILDTLGELPTILSVSDKVYLGGGLGAEGGHNPYEPAQFGLPIATGPNVKNHQQAFDMLANTKSITHVTTPSDLAAFLSKDQMKNAAAISAFHDRIDQSIQDTITQLHRL